MQRDIFIPFSFRRDGLSGLILKEGSAAPTRETRGHVRGGVCVE